MPTIIDTAIDAAQHAGQFLIDNFGKIRTVERKIDFSLATNVDQGAEKMLIDTIRSRFPQHSIMAEETGGSLRESDTLWIIDPLDGTHNYIHSIPLFGVSIGIVRNDEFIAGVVYMPWNNEMYVAEKGSGAFKNKTRIAVSRTAALKESYISFDSSINEASPQYHATLTRVSNAADDIRMIGSSARALTWVAEGKFDANVEFKDFPWDFAGSVCLIREAGGIIRAFDRGPMRPVAMGYIASNGLLHEELELLCGERGARGRG